MRFVVMMAFVGVLLLNLRMSEGIRFVIDREECFSHNVQYEGDTVHVSFVVIKAESPWHYGDDGVDLVVSFFNLFPSFSLPFVLLFLLVVIIY